MHLFPNGAIRYDANGDAWVTKYTLWWKITSLWLGLWRRTQ